MGTIARDVKARDRDDTETRRLYKVTRLHRDVKILLAIANEHVRTMMSLHHPETSVSK